MSWDGGQRWCLPVTAHANVSMDHVKPQAGHTTSLGFNRSFHRGLEKPNPQKVPSQLPESPGHMARLRARAESYLKVTKNKLKEFIKGDPAASKGWLGAVFTWLIPDGHGKHQAPLGTPRGLSISSWDPTPTHCRSDATTRMCSPLQVTTTQCQLCRSHQRSLQSSQ